MSLINGEIQIDLPWSRYCIISEISRISTVVPSTDPVEYEVGTTPISATFQINKAELYETVVTL